MNNSVLVGIAILLIFMVPIVWVLFNSNKKLKSRKNLVKKLCEAQGIIVNDSTQVGNALIGVDFKNKKMFHTSLQNLESEFIVVPLDNLTNLSLVEESYPSKSSILHVNIVVDTKEAKHLLNVYDDRDQHLTVTDSKACSHDAKQWIAQVKPQLL